MTRTRRLTRTTLMAFVVLAAVPSAWGWGCQGHEIVALIAEAHLNPRARAIALKILADGPISPTLSRYCKEPGLDPFVDSSTWPDDIRTIRPDGSPWHFIDIPRGASESDIAKYCPPATSCITGALADQLAILRNSNSSAQTRADALRFIIHFLGDIHQPLHDITNNDRGGNCVPVAFFNRMPKETNPTLENYNPNLHGVWDVDILERSMNGQTPQQAADDLDHKFQAQIQNWQSQPPNFVSWAWEGHQLGERIVYGQLPVEIAIETPRPVDRCADDDHISTRMLHLNESLGPAYQDAAAPVVREQLAKAGIRLAGLLNSIWP
ncbi:MAG TPA: S1/P1 nuclease [Candidatus Acidoferrales bacterium]|nr:S1/P1 nuclease [Candidatus Acidoferrales bacterium]